jgi:hypothetical protein
LLFNCFNLFLEFVEALAGAINAFVDGCQIIFCDFVAHNIFDVICCCFRADSLTPRK